MIVLKQNARGKHYFQSKIVLDKDLELVRIFVVSNAIMFINTHYTNELTP